MILSQELSPFARRSVVRLRSRKAEKRSAITDLAIEGIASDINARCLFMQRIRQKLAD